VAATAGTLTVENLKNWNDDAGMPCINLIFIMRIADIHIVAVFTLT